MSNMARFSLFLRENGMRVPSSSLLDAIRGLPLVDPSRMEAFRHLLRSNLVCRREDWERFDELFRRFFLEQESFLSPAKRAPEPAGQGAQETTAGESLGTPSPLVQDPSGPREAASMRYSPHALHQERDLKEMPFSAPQELSEALAKLLRPLAHRPSRRTRYTLHGREISLRRLFRKNIQFGGDLIFLDFKERRIKRRRLIFLCDVSGSMDMYTLMILQFAHALRKIDRRTEILFFSTELTRVTEWFGPGDFGAALNRLPSAVGDWGGGTRIGHCLKAFAEVFGGKLLAGRPIVMIYSDGWDRGEIPLLERQMSLLKRRAHKVIWLNPLAGIREYQPICRGMAAALPYVDYFLPVSRLHDLQRLERTLETLIA